LHVGRLPGPGRDRPSARADGGRGQGAQGAARAQDGPSGGDAARAREVQGLRSGHRPGLRGRPAHLPSGRAMKIRLRTLLLVLTSVAIAVLELGQIPFDIRERVAAAKVNLATQTQQLATAGAPLLLNALVVGDLATAEQILHHLNADLLWRKVVLYEND